MHGTKLPRCHHDPPATSPTGGPETTRAPALADIPPRRAVTLPPSSTPDTRLTRIDAESHLVRRAANAPIPVHIQDPAVPFWLLAGQDPDPSTPMSPFWSETPVPLALLVPSGCPLLAFLHKVGAQIQGLRLASGVLVLMIERRGLTAQIRIAQAVPFPAVPGLVVHLARLCASPAGDLPAAQAPLGCRPRPGPRLGRFRGEPLTNCSRRSTDRWTPAPTAKSPPSSLATTRPRTGMRTPRVARRSGTASNGPAT